MDRLEVDGKFFRAGGDRVFLKMVSYGPFPDPQPDHGVEMRRIAEAGFNAVRIYHDPGEDLLNAAEEQGLWVFVGLEWQWWCDFFSDRSIYADARMKLKDGLEKWGDHTAVAGVFVANEVPADMVRWMGVPRVRRAVENLIGWGRRLKPELLFAYANFPTTEFLEPENADFTAINVYLEKREDFAAYLPRLHNVAGDRPVLLSEFGLDTRRRSEISQRESMLWCVEECLWAGMAGLAAYTWSDRWLNRGKVVEDWDFGLTDRQGRDKPALLGLARVLPGIESPEDGIDLRDWPMFSVVVCTHNGGHRMPVCLRALRGIDYPNYEVIVVDDGSTDNTALVVKGFDGVRLIQMEHVGLSAARNKGAEEAKGEIIAYTDDDCEPDTAWLMWLAHAFASGRWAAVGGPNLAPLPVDEDDVDEAVVASAPGAPSHVLLGDREAEHLPGCNLVVRKSVFEKLGGFRETYWVAGDDVDFCWRLGEAGFRMGFCGGAFVWHRRRTTLWRYFRQQYGYGKAEALLMRDHPERFRRGSGALWRGRVYVGGAMCADQGSVIYHGQMGTASYQQLMLTMQPQRPLPDGFDGLKARLKLALARYVQPRVRGFARWWYSLRWRHKVDRVSRRREYVLVDHMVDYNEYEARWWGEGGVCREVVLGAVIKDGWQVLENDSDWDAVRDGLRLLVACEPHDAGTIVLTRMEMGVRCGGRLPADFVRRMEAMGLIRV